MVRLVDQDDCAREICEVGGEGRMGKHSQWIGSIAAVVTAGIAFTAYNSPVFQNQILREENSRLQIEKNSLDNMVKETSKLIWSYACTEFPLSLQITFQGYHPESRVSPRIV